MNTPEPIRQLVSEFEGMQTREMNAILLTETTRLHDRLLAAATGDSPEFELACDLYQQILSFSAQICTEMKLADRRERREMIRNENKRRGALAGSGSNKHIGRRGVPQRPSNGGYVQVSRARDYDRTGRRVHQMSA
jgi:hypothetical protein